MASWNRDLPDPHAGDDLAYAEAWETRIRDADPDFGEGDTDTEEDERFRRKLEADVEYADEDEAGQLGLGVPGEQRAIPSLAKVGDVPVENIDAALRFRAERPER